MWEADKHPYLVPFDDKFAPASLQTAPPEDAPEKKALKAKLKKSIDALDELQHMLYAHDRYAVLLVFQAMDAAGKDSTIRAVLSGLNPAGFQVYSFKQPSTEELDHDFLWRSSRRLPERGRIGVFNRSYYEEVLVVRVHPEFLQYQRLPDAVDTGSLWQQRYESIRCHERHLAENGTIILKFWLNVSREEQRNRFLSRLEEQEKHWKFSAGDVEERQYWDDYQEAYVEAVAATSRPWAPWYAIPADNKPYMRWCVADVLEKTLQSLPIHYPRVSSEDKKQFRSIQQQLEEESSRE